MSVSEFAARQARVMSSALNVRNAKGAEPISPVERATMRLSILIPAVFVFAAPAVAQNWQEYSYPDYSFRVTFPADPQIETTTYQVTDDHAVEAHVYSVHRDNAEFKVTVAELADPGLEETAVIDHAIKTLSEGGEVKVNIAHRINRVLEAGPIAGGGHAGSRRNAGRKRVSAHLTTVLIV
jgi:hypothetical protein